jgi:hypothetical protein
MDWSMAILSPSSVVRSCLFGREIVPADDGRIDRALLDAVSCREHPLVRDECARAGLVLAFVERDRPGPRAGLGNVTADDLVRAHGAPFGLHRRAGEQ